VCGGLTTFSTMQVEALAMIDAHDYLLAAGYLVASVAAGLVAVHLTTQLTRRVRVRRR
jgi:CrcB protein